MANLYLIGMLLRHKHTLAIVGYFEVVQYINVFLQRNKAALSLVDFLDAEHISRTEYDLLFLETLKIKV